MSGGVVSRSRQLGGHVAARLRAHGIEIVPFVTVACLVAGLWCVLSLPAFMRALNLRVESVQRSAAPAVRVSVQPRVHFRVIASTGGATMPESNPPAKRSRTPPH
jgi:hypothetical protein